MNGSSRRKGKVAEQEVVNLLKARGFEAERAWEDAHKTGGQEYGDLRLGKPYSSLTGIYYPEVRRRERLDIPKWMEETEERAMYVLREPLLIVRKSRMPWWACVKLDHLMDLWKIIERREG